MSYEHLRPGRVGSHDTASGHADAIASSGLAPGKRTLVEQVGGGGAIQRKPAGNGGGARARAASDDDWIDAAFGSPAIQRKAGGAAEPAQEPAGGTDARRELPGDVRGKMETAMNADFSAVRIHEGPQASAMGALAYTQGADIHFAPGQYDPSGRRGQELLGHELAHVVQQAQGRVPGTAQAKGAGGAVMLNEDPSLEREADELGARAASGAGAGAASGGGRVQAAAPAGGAIQLYRDYEKTESSQRGGGGGDYKLLQETGYHIKLHPLGGQFEDQVWDELHVTFELFQDDKLCPKVYFDDQGERLEGHDDDFVNRNYQKFYAGKGHPAFDTLIETAKRHAAAFLKRAPPFLDRSKALALVDHKRRERQRLEQIAKEEDQRLRPQRDEHAREQRDSFGSTYTKEGLKPFGSQGGRDEKDVILESAGLIKGQGKYALVKMMLWDKPKTEWEKSGCGALFDQVKLAREEHERSKETTIDNGEELEEVHETTPSSKVDDHATTDEVKQTAPAVDHGEATEKVSQAIEQSGMSRDQARELGQTLEKRGGDQVKDPQQLGQYGVPPFLIVLALSLGILVLGTVLRWL